MDLLVRSFNEIFSPMIETGDVRIRKSHNVDDLTDYYRSDESGNIIPNSELVSIPHWNIDKIKSIPQDEQMLLSPRNLNPMAEYRTTNTSSIITHRESKTNSNSGNAPNPLQDNTIPSSYTPEKNIRKKYKHRGGYYVPGKRPFVDFLIKLVERFQLTANSKFITSRARYGNGQLQYEQ